MLGSKSASSRTKIVLPSSMNRLTSGPTLLRCTLPVRSVTASERWGLMVVLVCAIGAACQGWDQTGSNGASRSRPRPCASRSRSDLSFPAEFGIGREFDEPGGKDDEVRRRASSTRSFADGQWKVGFVNSCPYIGAALLSVLEFRCGDTSDVSVAAGFQTR